MHRTLGLLVLMLVIPVATQAFESVDDPRRWAIIGLNVIDVETGEIAPAQAIVIERGVIETVAATASIDLQSVDLIVNLDGQYAIPGLWDSHIHLRGGPELIDANERWLRQYLGYGVTSVREAGGDIPGSVLHWKASIEQGSIVGPRIYSALLKLDGPGERQPGAIPIGTKSDIDDALGNLEFMGADFIKLYEISYPPELFAETIRRAEARGLKTAAHAPLYVPFRDLIDAGLDSVEHVFFLAKATNPDDDTLSSQMSRIEPWDTLAYFVEYSKMADRVDESYARETFRMMARAGTAMTPTLAIESNIAKLVAGDYELSERDRQVPSEIRATLDEANEWMVENSEAARSAWGPLFEHSSHVLRLAASEGVMVMAGSDTGVDNALVYPGDSLHLELELLVDFGLSPLQALQAATTNPAIWMGLQGTFGSLAEGKVADIVVLAANPLEDISNTRSITAVVQQGVFFDAEELEDLRQLVGK